MPCAAQLIQLQLMLGLIKILYIYIFLMKCMHFKVQVKKANQDKAQIRILDESHG